MIWFIVLNVVMSNGDVYSDLHFPNSPQYNNEKECNESGQALVDQKQIEVGTANGKAYFICIPIEKSKLDATVGSNSNS